MFGFNAMCTTVTIVIKPERGKGILMHEKSYKILNCETYAQTSERGYNN